MKIEIFKYNSVTSTNDVAIKLIEKENKDIGCVHAKEQTKGRGTQGKVWISNKGNLFISIFFKLEKNYPPFSEFSVINSVIVFDVLKHFCKDKNLSLKFPNDVFLNEKKICGILQETITHEEKKFLIIGIGINVISNPTDIDIMNLNSGINKYKATNIFFETKKKIETKEIFDLIINYYINFFKNLNIYNYAQYKKKAESLSIN